MVGGVRDPSLRMSNEYCLMFWLLRLAAWFVVQSSGLAFLGTLHVCEYGGFNNSSRVLRPIIL